MIKLENAQRKQLNIFLIVAFALPFALGIPMGIGHSQGMDLSVFPTAQMCYPAAGVMLAALITRKGDPLLPRRFFIGFIAFTALQAAFALFSVILPDLPWNMISEYSIIAASILCLVLLMTEKKDKRLAYGLKGGHWGATAAITLLFAAMLVGRAAILSIIGGVESPLFFTTLTPFTLVILAFKYFLSFTAFFGEEYGWRYYLQPLLQKRFGMVRGVLLLGLMWGLWHLPLNFFYYTTPAYGLISAAGQVVTCITLGAFFGWAYLLTDNIYLPVILHFVNNNLIALISGITSDTMQSSLASWEAIPRS